MQVIARCNDSTDKELSENCTPSFIQPARSEIIHGRAGEHVEQRLDLLTPQDLLWMPGSSVDSGLACTLSFWATTKQYAYITFVTTLDNGQQFTAWLKERRK